MSVVVLEISDMPDVMVIEADLQDQRHQAAIVYLIDAYARDPMGDGEDLPAEVRDRLIPGFSSIRHH